MSREIKFRGKRVGNGEWVCGDLHQGMFTGNPYIGGCEVIPETVGQYTGLKDRDGFHIYEGDVLRNVDNPLSDKLPFKVVWNDYYGAWFWLALEGEDGTDHLYHSIASDCEIIGNIHEGEDDIDTNNNNWQLVTWQEAIQAWANGKMVYVENKAGGRVYRYGGESEKMYLLTSEITTGTWYVED